MILEEPFLVGIEGSLKGRYVLSSRSDSSPSLDTEERRTDLHKEETICFYRALEEKFIPFIQCIGSILLLPVSVFYELDALMNRKVVVV